MENNEKEIITLNNLRISMGNIKSQLNNQIINLKMKKINKNINQNSDDIRSELKKLLNDLHSSKSFHHHLKKIYKLKLTPYQKMLKENQKAKKALSIKQKLFNKNFLFDIENITINHNFNNNKTEKSLNTGLNDNTKKKYNNNNFSTRKVIIPSSRNINSYKNIKNNEIFKTAQKKIKKEKKLNQSYYRTNILLLNESKSFSKNRSYRNRDKIKMKTFFDNYKCLKTYSKLNMNIPVLKKTENKYMNSFRNEANELKLKPLILLSNNKFNNNFFIKENKKREKIKINNNNILIPSFY